MEMKTIPTNELIVLLGKYTEEKNQDLINICAYELACRVYVPGKEYSFEDVLYNFGYKMKMENQITIEEIVNKKRG